MHEARSRGRRIRGIELMERVRFRQVACALAGLGILAGCDGGPAGEIVVRETREIVLDGEDRFTPVPSAERFGFRMRGDERARADAAGMDGAPRLAWETPDGWEELAPSQFREANFRVGGDERAECYLTVLGGDAGGLVANVDRWRAQLGLGPTSAEELADAPRSKLLGLDAIRVDFTGSFRGMGTGVDGGEEHEGWRLVGLVGIHSAGSVFLKMTGPAEVIANELRAFEQLAASFRVETGPAATTKGPSAPGAGATADAGGGGGLAWTLPAGWRRAPDDAMRLAGFWVDEGEDLMATLTVLTGDGGGLEANVARWRRQLGLGPPSAAELAALPRIEVLGSEGYLVESEGEARLLGAIALLPGRSVFVKLSGPDARVAAQREAFLSFCESLEEAR
jgi:hypothetical protein